MVYVSSILTYSTMNKNNKIKKDLYFGAKLRAKSIDSMTYCHEIDKWVETEKVIKHYYETGEIYA